jgi:hypothetical protein
MLEVWPNVKAYFHGGVGFEPYRAQFKDFLPSDDFSYQEFYNASEGFFATQDILSESDLLLLLDNGIYYEFLPESEWNSEKPVAINLRDVESGKRYALVISTNSGLWRYIPGDTIEFTSLKPYRIKVIGRIQQYINVFGEEVMVSNTDKAVAVTSKKFNVHVNDYTVAPIFFKQNGKGGHEWLVEFDHPPADIKSFAVALDQNLQDLNSDYEAKRYQGMALQNLKLNNIPSGTFNNWLASKGKLGAQHKVPRLSNDRQYIDEIIQYANQSIRGEKQES